MKYFGLLLILIVVFVLPAKSQEVSYQYANNKAFMENKGQWPNKVLFKNKIYGGNMWVEQHGILFQMQDYSRAEEAHFSKKSIKKELTFREHLIYLEFVGSQKSTVTKKKGQSEFYHNYYIGNDKQKWASNVRGYEEFVLDDIYRGIDLHYVNTDEKIKYEFIVSPKTDHSVIQLRYANSSGLKIDKDGNLIIKTELGDIIEKKPYVYQIVNGKIVDIPCNYVINDKIVTFEIGEYNNRVDLIIDPTLVFATYCGAVSDNFGMTATYGYDGSAFSGGTVYGNSYPTPDPNVFDPNSSLTLVNVGTVTTDAFITKFSSDGTTMLWTTFIGGGDNTKGTDVPHSLICDRQNNVYVFGTTSSLDFPTANGFQSTFGGGTPLSISYNGTHFGTEGTDIFVSKLSTDAHTLIGSTYVGGEQNDGVNYMDSAGAYPQASDYDSLTSNYGDQFRGEIMLDSINNIIVGSCTRSDSFPTKNAFQDTIAGYQDGVIFKVKNDFSELVFSSYYGGKKADAIYSVKVDSSHNVVFCGGTTSEDLTITPGTYQSTYNGGQADGFIGKLSTDGQTLTHSTYVGTANYDQTFFIEIDRVDNIYVLGQSNGGSFPVINSAYQNPGSSQFVAKLAPDLSSITNSTVFGSGSSTFDISPAAFMVDICGNIYISGWGANLLQSVPMSGMPVTPNAFQQTAPDGFDFHLMVIKHGFTSLLYGTYLGGHSSLDHVDGGTSRFNKDGIIYQCVCGGCGGVSDFPTSPGAWSSQNLASNCNALTFKFDFNLIPNAEITADQTIGCTPLTIQFDNYSSQSDSYMWDFGNGDLDSTTFEPIKTYTEPGIYEVMLTVTDSICLLTDSSFITIEVYPDMDLQAGADQELCEPDTVQFQASTNGSADSFIWSSDPAFSDTLNTSLLDSTAKTFVPAPGYYYVKATNQGCSVIDSVYVSFISAKLSIAGDTMLCVGDETQLTAFSSDPQIIFTDFEWSNDSVIVSGRFTETATVNPKTTQYIYVTALASNGCVVTDSILVSTSYIDETTIDAYASDTLVPNGNEVTLFATPDGYIYQWSPTEGVDFPDQQETPATVNNTTHFTVEISDGICSIFASTTVYSFPYTCEEPFIYVPNAFSPNGDGENDILYLRSQIVSDVIFRIYDRWGEKVFESHSLHDGWDGTFRGKPLDPDVYDYYLDGHCLDGQEFIIKGNITLIR